MGNSSGSLQVVDSPQSRLDYFIRVTFKTKKDFSDKIGIHRNDISKYTGNGKTVFSYEDSQKKLAGIGLNYHWYLTGEGEMLLNNKKNISPNIIQTTKPDGYKVKFVTVSANAGKGYNFNDIPEAEIMVTQDYGENVIAFNIDGDSMFPTLKHGERVLCDKSIEIRNFDVIICIVDGLLYCKRLIIENDIKFLRSDNNNYPDIKINGFNNSQIIGKVFEYKGTL